MIRSALAFASVTVFACLSGAVSGSTFQVNVNTDNNISPPVGSLREAINLANSTPGTDTITFNIGGGGLQTITPVADLPAITDPVIIDGTTQPGFAGNPLIELNGTSAGAVANGLSLTANSGGSTVRGLIINRFGRSGIYVTSSNGNVIAGNWIGLDNTGTAVSSNGADWPNILLSNAGDNLIGGTTAGDRNVICGARYGIALWDPATTTNTVSGNWVGLLPSGSSGTGPTLDCVTIFAGAHSNTIGGTTAGAGNVLSNALRWGIGIGEAAFPDSGNNVIQGNMIGTNDSGTLDFGNSQIGVYVIGCSSNLIGGTTADARNVISGNNGYGIYFDAAATSNTVQNNYIGVNATGDAAIPNGQHGIEVRAATQIIGGAGSGNVISGNGLSGINMNPAASGTIIQGNIIGLAADGSGTVANGSTGIEAADTSSVTLGGASAGQGNIVSGNAGKGVVLIGASSTGNFVQGNIIGLNANGDSPRPNGLDGLWVLSGSNNNVIGGLTDDARNIVSGNGQRGIVIDGAGTSANTVVNNFVGTSLSGAVLIPNASNGIYMGGGATGTIGGTGPNDGNLVSGNGSDGINLPDGTGIRALGNRVAGNTGLGINRNLPGVEPNNAGDADNVQNYPEILVVEIDGSETSVTGRLSTSPTTSCDLEFFRSPSADPSGFGEGAALLGRTTVVSNGSGEVYFNVSFPVSVTAGEFITATATSVARGTSEFSQARQAPYSALVVVNTSDSGVGSLRDCMMLAGQIPGANTITFNIPGAGVHTITPASALPAIQETVTIDATTQPGYAGNPLIELSGVSAGGASDAFYIINAGSSGSSIRGFTINLFGASAIKVVSSSNVTITSNWIGLNNSGNGLLSNGLSNPAILLSDSSDNQIGGTTAGARNIVCGSQYGIAIWNPGSTTNTVTGNWVGLLADGSAGSGPTFDCVSIFAGAHSNTIGGTVAGAGNVLSNATRWGVGIGESSFPLAGNNIIQGNMIGTNDEGTADFGNGQIGVYIVGCSNNLVGGTSANARNVISGNNAWGVYLDAGASANRIQNNYIGVTAAGASSLPNGISGIEVRAGNQVIGEIGAGNVISGNGLHGINLTSAASGSIIQGNIIGLNAAGNGIVPNAQSGIEAVDTSLVTIGGSSAGEGNTVSGNNGKGIVLIGSASAGNTVQGNIIGLDSTGDVDLGNALDGLWVLSGSKNNIIGGSTALARNIVSGNNQRGIVINGVGTGPNTVTNNYVGTDITGAVLRGNTSNGIYMGGGAVGIIGGPGANDGNLVAGNGSDGINLPDGTGIEARRNLAYANAGLGINRNLPGVEPNNAGDADNVQNYPVIQFVELGASETTISGILSTSPSTSCDLEFFRSPSADPSGFGEGQTYIGGTTIVSNGSGEVYFTAVLPVVIPAGEFVTATATSAARGTSEFSEARLAPYSVLVVVNTNDSGVGSLRDCIELANMIPGSNTITFNIPGLGVHSIAPLSQLPLILETVTIDATTQPGFAGSPLIELNGTSAGAVSVGLTVFDPLADGSILRGFIINRFGRSGILLHNTDGNVIAGNWLGVNSAGNAASSNGDWPNIYVTNSALNRVGGTSTADRNVICAGRYGVALWDPESTSNTVAGNWIGFTPVGQAAAGPIFDCISITDGANGNTIGGTDPGAGNILSNASRWGIGIGEAGEPGGNVVQGNLIGTNLTGTAAWPNAALGVYITGSPDNIVGGPTAAARNIISGNGGHGVYVDGASAVGNIFRNNFIGVDASGTVALGNNGNGFTVLSGGQVIGSAGTGNVISGNAQSGIFLSGVGSTIIQGNLVGVDVTGTVAIANGSDGMVLIDSFQTDIGGSAAGNLVSGNSGVGIVISGAASTSNTLQSNIVGLNLAGNAALGNGDDGIRLVTGAKNNTVGGTLSGAGNVVSGNAGRGILVYDAGTGPNTIINNLVGTNAAGNALIGNGLSGVLVGENASATVGGTSAGEGNVIAGNQEGILVLGTPNLHALGNSIYDNTALGIDISPGGVTANDALDADGLQNYPIITSVTTNGSQTSVAGTIVSSPGTVCRLEFFSSPSADSSGFGEGRTYLGSYDVTTNAGGLATFSTVLAVGTNTGDFVTATATTSARGTSEFSKAVSVPTELFVVTNTNDSGQGSLRQCILNANAVPGANVIRFDIAPGGAQTISPLSELPDITETVTIDATTQPGFSGTPLIELNGLNAGAGSDGLTVAGANSTGSALRGFVVNRFDRIGILLTSTSGTLVAGNWLGVSGDGVTSAPNSPNWANIYVQNSPLSVIGGTTPADRNVICGGRYGVALWNAATTSCTVVGNWFGLLPDGVTPAGQTFECISVLSGSHHNVIGGTAPGAGNVISASGRWGVHLADAGSPGGNVVQGNLIGTDPTGTIDYGNAALGIYIWQTPDNVIGGSTPAARNIIAGTNGSGILTSGPLALRNVIHGNFIGLDITGAAMPNTSYGVLADDSAQVVVGSGVSESNQIAFNGLAGVRARTTTDVLVLGNSIHDNGALGIDVSGAGVTLNDAGDVDPAQNKPVLTDVESDGSVTTVTGTLSTFALATVHVEFFRSPTADPSGSGEGETFMDSATVLADGAGNATFTAVLPTATPVFHYVTATATTPEKGTSEFSNGLPVNTPPVAAEDAYTTDEDTTLTVAAPGVLANDSDVDGTSPTAVLGTAPTNGTLVFNSDGSFTYVPDADVNGSDTFTYFAADAFSQSEETTVTITITPINDAPVGTEDSYSTDEDVTLNVAAPGVLGNDTDIDSAVLTSVVESGPSLGTVTLNADGSFEYVPTPDANGTDTFTYRADDGSSVSEATTVTITINPVNDAPVAMGDTYVTDEDTTLVVIAPGVLTNDSDIDSVILTAAVDTLPSSGTLSLNPDGSFTYEPNPDANGSDQFTYHADDGDAVSQPVTVTIIVNPINDAPVAVADAYATDEDVALTVPQPGVLTNDSDIDSASVTAVVDTLPAFGAIALNPDGSFTYTPNADTSGPDEFTYHADDGSSASEITTVTITVNPINDAPVAAADAYSTDEDTTLTVAAPGVLGNDSDVEGDPLSAILVAPASQGVVSLLPDGSFTYVPDPDTTGTDQFTYSAFDGSEQSPPVTVTITINAINDAPLAAPDAYITTESTTLFIGARGVLENDLDVDEEPISAVLDATTANGALILNADGSLSYTPATAFTGEDTFTYHANDGTTDSEVTTVTITVAPDEKPPVAVEDVYSTNEDTTLNVIAPGVLSNDSDPNLDGVAAELVSGPSHGGLTLNSDGSFTYIPNGNFNGSDIFTYRATDGALDSEITTVTIVVNPVNDAPVANDDAFSTFENVALNVPAPGVLVDDTDLDGSSLNAVQQTGPGHGTLTLNSDGSFVYTPDGGFSGIDTFTYQATDGLADSNTATVTISVGGVAEQADLAVQVAPRVLCTSFDLVVSNLGPDAATEVLLTALNNGMTPGAVTPSQGTVMTSGPETLVFLGTIGPGGTATVNVLIAAQTGGATVDVTVGASQPDPVPSNNTAQVIVDSVLEPPAPDTSSTIDLSGSWRTRGVLKRGRFKGRLRLVNLGTGVVPAANVTFYVSDDATFDCSDMLVDSRNTRRIRPAPSVTTGRARTTWPSPRKLRGVALDGKYLLAVIDPVNAVPENVESNNVIATVQLHNP